MSQFRSWRPDSDAPQSINEMQLEAMRIEAEVEKKRLEEQTRQRQHRRINGEGRLWLALIVGLCLLIGAGITGATVSVIEGTRAEVVKQRQNQDVIRACVSSGGEWKENLNRNFECVRR